MRPTKMRTAKAISIFFHGVVLIQTRAQPIGLSVRMGQISN